MSGARPLEGVRVIDLTRAMAGPFCTMMLADMGADVIKIEPPEGDESRQWAPPKLGYESAYFMSVNKNKRSVVLDLKTETGREVLYKLVERSDVFVENFRPSVTSRLGVNYEKLSSINPKLVYCSISAFGQWGPYRDKPGYDIIALAMSGHMSVTGSRGGEPVKYGVPIADITTGMYAAFAIVNALLLREKTKRGTYIDASLLDVQVALLTHQATSYFATGRNPERMGSAHASIAPYQAFRAKDGYVVIGVANDKFWRQFCEAIGAEHLAEDERFRTNEDRVRNRDVLVKELEEVLTKDHVASWVEKLERYGIPVAPVKAVGEVLNDEHVLARGMVEELESQSGHIKLLSSPILFDNERYKMRRPPPKLGEHTEEVLIELGYSKDDVEKMRREGIVR